MVIFNSFLLVYQRVTPKKKQQWNLFRWSNNWNWNCTEPSRKHGPNRGVRGNVSEPHMNWGKPWYFTWRIARWGCWILARFLYTYNQLGWRNPWHGDKFHLHRCILVRRILRRWSNSTRIPRLKSAQVCSNVMQRATDLHRENGANKKGRAYVSLGKGSQRDM